MLNTLPEHEDRNCHADTKPFYSIAEAAVRWCNVKGRPVELDEKGMPVRDVLNPCLRARAEHVFAAIQDGTLPYGRDGVPVRPGEHVARPRITIRHADLKRWMAEHFPGDKPAFLFDAMERATHSAINADSFRALQADRDALKRQLETAEERARRLELDLNRARAELKPLQALADQGRPMGERERATYLHTIGALLRLMLDRSPAGQPYSALKSQADVISKVLARHPDVEGLAASTLEHTFADANRAIATAR